MENERIIISEQTKGETEKGMSISALGVFLTSRFDESVQFRESCGMSKELEACQCAVLGEYTPNEKSKRDAENLPEIFIPISDTKRRTANAWAGDIFLNTSEKPYELHATPVPDMPQEVEAQIAQRIVEEYAMIVSGGQPPQSEAELQAIAAMAQQRRDDIENLVKEEAERRAARLDRIVHDKMVEGRWREEMMVAIDYASTYGTCVVKLVRRNRKRRVRTVNKYGVSSFTVKSEARLELQAIDPNDCYPSKGSVSITDGYFCQRIRFQPYDLELMKGQKATFDDAINQVLQETADNGWRTFQNGDALREDLNNDGNTSEASSIIEGFEFWGTVHGSKLFSQGVNVDSAGKPISRDKFYEIDAIVVKNQVVYLEMTDPRLPRPLFKGTFYHVPGSWWGESPIKKMRHLQRIINGAATSLMVNMSMAAGPQVAITDFERLVDKDFSQKPWKTWVFRQSRFGNTTDVPIKFFQPNANASELLGVYDRAIRDVDNVTGIPAYAHGSDIAAGAGRTASGLSMLLDAAQRGMKAVVFSIDMDLMRPLIQYIVDITLLESDDEGIKGDVTIDAGGLLSILTRDKSIAQLQDFLALCQNPLVANVLGEDGIAEIVRKIVQLIPHINPDRVVPSREERELRKLQAQLEQLKMMQAQQQLQLQGQAQAQAAGLTPPPGEAGMKGQVPLQDGIANVAAMGGQTPGSAFNQYQPNAAPEAPHVQGPTPIMGA